MCTRTGCFNCGAGMHDPDHDVLTECVDCPDGLTSGPEASTGCTEPPADIWATLEWLIGLFTAMGFTPLTVECYEFCCKHGEGEHSDETGDEEDGGRTIPLGRDTRRAVDGQQRYTQLSEQDQP